MPFHHSEPPNAFPAAPFPPTRPNSAKHISATSDSSTPLTSENRTESTRRLRRTSPDMESRESTRKRGVRTDSLRSGRIERTDTFLGLRNGVPVSRRPMGAVVARVSAKRSRRGSRISRTILTSDTLNRRPDRAGTSYDCTQRGIAGVRPKLRGVEARRERNERTEGIIGLLIGVSASAGPRDAVFTRVSAKRSKQGFEISRTRLRFPGRTRRGTDGRSSYGGSPRGIERIQRKFRQLCTNLL